ncbi:MULTISPECIES: anaerobic ribonucleoside-triphosphate reductase [Aquitalea]|uniref:Anaerobic ribonucleoside-triphosphate reductase-like protein n=1 Tax=Aquitalea magnusonii TaxID=332411 RepID=A0A318K7H2_9NEIS|nr:MULTISPECIES: anaerobic ribonucleoside-triphosphate reductase [Aquitalea]PXX50360.1 anaerobic ribonucleoside-triphosphate reductase-like protein [Aquitalea magnusonii]
MTTPTRHPQVISTAQLDPALRTRCEVWTRVMGYFRPVSAFNVGKQGEFAERLHFDEQHLHH